MSAGGRASTTCAERSLRRIFYHEIDSTNSEAQRRIASGDVTGPALITAAQQTAGRGRLGRHWVSPVGNFHGSFVVPKDDRPEWRRPWLLGAIAGLAVAETIERFVEDGAPVRLKWPNDVLVDDAKISGLLIENAGARPFLVVGIGVNLVAAPTDTPYPATCLDRHRAAPVNPTAFTDALVAAMAAMNERWLSLGFAALRPAYRARTHRPGDPLSVQLGERRVQGRFVDVDDDGFLLLESEGRTLKISAGDVLAGRA
jgi:BirA family biotin operon repressor/biotin-[acetyl-CoA-carboxylase] ligase